MLRTITVVGACFMMFLADTYQAAAQENLEQLVAGAKKEGEVTLVASASTFGGKKGFADLEAGFNKRFGLKHKLNLAPGPPDSPCLCPTVGGRKPAPDMPVTVN